MKIGQKTGFTIIEVILVLAISGALFVGLIAAQGNNLARRRYNDAVFNFVDFVQGQYDFGTNIQNWREGTLPAGSCGTNPGGGNAHLGRSGCVIYGMILEFGNGECNTNPAERTGRCFVRYSWVVGEDYNRDALFEIGGAGLGGLDDYEVLGGVGLRRVVPFHDYHIEWGGGLETPSVASSHGTTASSPDVRGAMLILRLPISGTIMTFLYNDDLTAVGLESAFSPTYPTDNDDILTGDNNAVMVSRDASAASSGNGLQRIVSDARNVLDAIEGPSGDMGDPRRFKFMCIGSPDSWQLGGARSKRILAITQGGSNASAVQLLEQDPVGGTHNIDGGNFDVRCP
ncbi:prepilin-type N-terminal cleavage/methylation domain-containing protein [Candidatus Saccharibacteria bacterium]|nr:prepilin-type N-terminal cleavage/methylation domain-containing protein [Candidatus Saccharibacteria bacterium]